MHEIPYLNLGRIHENIKEELDSTLQRSRCMHMTDRDF